MKLEKEEKELLIGVCAFIVSAFLFGQSSVISLSRYKLIESARIFPLLVSSLMCILSIAYVIRSYRRCGWVPMAKIAGAFKTFCKEPLTQGTVKAILLVGVYYWLAAAKGRFYIVSTLFIVFISCVYVKGNPIWRIVGTLGFIVGAYFLFYRGFHVQLY